jgi:hypothetical protein
MIFVLHPCAAVLVPLKLFSNTAALAKVIAEAQDIEKEAFTFLPRTVT